MPNLLDKLRTALRRPTSTTEQLAAALADARQADADARHAVERQVEAVAAGYLDPAPARAKAREALADLRATAEDAALILAEAERQHAAAVAADADAVRRAAYDAAKAKADAAALALARTYPTLARGLVAMLRDLAEAQQAVAAVNVDLPPGVPALIDPEFAARGTPGLPREIVSEVEVVLWTRDGDFKPMPDEAQADIRDGGNGWGWHEGAHAPHFRQRRYIKRTVRAAVYAVDPVPLAAMVQLPAVRGSGLLWEAAGPFDASADPAGVIARAAAAEDVVEAVPSKAVQPIAVEWQDLGEVTTQGLLALPSAEEARALTPSTMRHGASPFNPASFGDR